MIVASRDRAPCRYTCFAVSAPGLLTLIGSGEASAGMVRTHRVLLERLGPAAPRAVFLETPAGFELGIEAIVARFQEYFRTSLGLDLRPARYRHLDDPPEMQAEALAALTAANYIVAGPGSPTYAVEQLRDTPILAALIARWRDGAQLVFASAATIALGRHALPVYEIYKVGRPLAWSAGLDLLGPYGFELAIVPHWDNAEGGTHDTRACFMGLARFERLRALLPASAVVLGVDEHTAVTLDLRSGAGSVRGKGGVSILRGAVEMRYAAGEEFDLDVLRSPAPAPTGSAQPGREQSPAPASAVLGQAAARIGAGEVAAGLRLAASAAPEGLAAVLLQAAQAADSHGPSDDFGPLVELFIELRAGLRERGEWALADGLRDRLRGIGIELRDTPQGTIWVRLP